MYGALVVVPGSPPRTKTSIREGLAMKRDMDLVRKLLVCIEEDERATGRHGLMVSIEGYSDQEVEYHLRLIVGAGLVTTALADDGELDFLSAWPTGLTWEGHGFLEAARNDTIWKKATELVRRTTGGLAFELLKSTLIAFANRAVFSDAASPSP